MIFATMNEEALCINILKSMSTELVDFPLFKNLNPEAMELLIPLAEAFRYAPGANIFQQGERADYLYLLTHGQVDVCYRPYDGPTPIVTHINAGGVFGWSAVIGSKNYSSGAISVEPSEGWRILGNHLRLLCREHPEATREILERLATTVSSRWRDAHLQVCALLAESMTHTGR